jgi:hypothetical protein
MLQTDGGNMSEKRSTIYLRNVPADVMREIEAISAETGASIPEVARRLLAGAVASRVKARKQGEK